VSFWRHARAQREAKAAEAVEAVAEEVAEACHIAGAPAREELPGRESRLRILCRD